MPFIGPSSIRGAAGFAVDIQADPVRYIEQWELSTGLQALNIIDQRAGLIPAEAALEDVLDEYIVIRNVYLTRRAQLIADDPTAVAPEKEKSSTDEVDCEEIETVKEYEACVEAQQTL